MSAPAERNSGMSPYGYTGTRDSERNVPWRARHLAYLQCREETEAAGKEHWKNGNMDPGTARLLCDKFGIDRTGTFLSFNVYKRLREDGLTWDMRGWAGAYRTPTSEDLFTSAYICNIPAPALNALAEQYVDYVKALRLLGESAVLKNSSSTSYVGKVLILRPDSLPSYRRTGDDQLFCATGGYGCVCGNGKARVYGRFLADGEEDSFRREDFIGEADPEKLPAWAAERALMFRPEEGANPRPAEIALVPGN